MADTVPVNPSFENGQTGEHPPGWLAPSVKGYHVTIPSDRPKKGGQRAQIESEADA